MRPPLQLSLTKPLAATVLAAGLSLSLASSALADPSPNASAKLEQQRLQIENSEHGYFSAELLEPLQDLARTQREAGLYAESLQTISRAIQITRANLGLYSPEQLPLRKLELESLIATDQWEQARERLDHFNHLLSGHFALHIVDALETLDWLATAHWQGFARDAAAFKGSHLLQSTRYREVAVALLERQGFTASERYAEALNELGNSYYYESQALLHSADAAYALRQPRNQRLPMRSKTDALRWRFNAGLHTLQKLRQQRIDQFGADSEAAAMAGLQLADWQALFDDETAVEELYAPSLDGLRALGISSELIDRAFAVARPLPSQRPLHSVQQLLDQDDELVLQQLASDIPAFAAVRASSFSPADASSDQLTVELKHAPGQRGSSWARGYQTNSYLTVDSVELIASPEIVNHHHLERVLGQLQQLTLRPAFVDGRPSSSQLRLSLRFDAPHSSAEPWVAAGPVGY